MTTIEAMKQALESAANYIDVLGGVSKGYRMVLAEVLAQAEAQTVEPVGVVDEGLFADLETPQGVLVKRGDKLFTHPAPSADVKPTSAERKEIVALLIATAASLERGQQVWVTSTVLRKAANMLAADGQPKSFVQELAQLEQEWCELRNLKAQQVAVPQGYALVPEVCPADMEIAFCKCLGPGDTFQQAYRAMLKAAPPATTRRKDMSCNCKTELEIKLTERFKEKVPEASNHAAKLQGYGFAIIDNSMKSMGYMEVKNTADYPLKKGSKSKTTTMSMYFSYCPFCGEKT